jgi:hypothetical protein
MKMKSLLKLSVCFLLLITAAAPTFSQDVEYPLIQSMCYFPYSDNSLLYQGEYTVGLTLRYSNVYMFNHYRTIINDFEMFSNTISIRYGLADFATAEVHWRWYSLFGGFLDGFVESFHKFFRLPHNARAEFPRNTIHYRHGDYFSYEEKDTAASPLVLAFLNNIYTAEHFSFKSRFSIGIPLSNKPGFSSKRPFLSAGLLFHYKKKGFSIDFSNYIAWMKKPDWLADEPMRRQVFYSLLEFHLHRFIGGLIFRSSPFIYDDTAHPAYQFYIGYQITPNLDILFFEDFGPFDTSPDLSFGLRMQIFKKRL